MKNKFLLVACASAMMCGAAATSRAAEVVVDDSEADALTWVYRGGDYQLAPRDRLTVRSEGPAVYGWSFRPANCGVFHYWNGDECVDARINPPPQ